MYTDFYKLKEFPFNLTPDPRFVYYSPGHQEALAQMTYGIKMRRGFLSITGEVGTGKTTLIYTLLSRLDASTQKAFIFHSIVNAKGLFLSICREFGIAVNSDDTKTDMTIKLHNFLISNFRSGGNAVVIIDEAQNLTPHVLEEVRLLSNLETPRTKLLQILLVAQQKPQNNKPSNQDIGNKELSTNPVALQQSPGNGSPSGVLTWEQLRDRQVTQNQPIANILSQSDITSAGLINEDLAQHSNSSDIFLPRAVDEIYRYSDGIPRAINVLCDKALLMGYSLDASRITPEIVRKVELDDHYNEPEPIPEKPPSKVEQKNYQIADKFSEKINSEPFKVTVDPENIARMNKLRQRFPNLFSSIR
jgi:general secretion pathway protein A